jgi:hypothetical protein
LQYESDIVSFSALRWEGVTNDTVYVTNPTLKYGLTSNTDIEANISPLEIVHSRDGDKNRTIAGVGDLYFRFKYQFLNIFGGGVQATLLPYVKAPTARLGVGDGAVEGGVLMPINYKLNGALTLTTVPELDDLKDTVGEGRHLNTAQVVSLAISLTHKVSLYGEMWGDWNFDPTGLVRQYSADTAIAYTVSRLQLDAGVNIGLNRATPAAQVYIGISQRF